MTDTLRYFYRKKDKLKSRKTIDQLFSKGNSFSNFPFKIIWLPQTSGGFLQAAVGVSSRHFKKAVERNRIKRLMREAYRLQKHILDVHLKRRNLGLSVFILYTGKELPDYNTVFEKVGIILNRLIKFNDGNDQANA